MLALAIDPRRPELKFKLENRGVADIVALLSQGMAVDGLAVDVDGSLTVTDAFLSCPRSQDDKTPKADGFADRSGRARSLGGWAGACYR